MALQEVVEQDEALRIQAQALGDPTRHRIYCAVKAATEPVMVAELTDAFGLNHNAIRQHLAVLCRAGLVLEDLAPPTGRGRRRLRYRVAPAAAATWGGENPYEQLALLLVEVVHTGRSPRDVGYQAGRRAVSRRRGDIGDPLGTLVDLVARQGFEPALTGDGDHRDIVLGRCPFAAAAAADRTTVCELHRGLAEGMADALGGAFAVTDLVARHPKRAGCRIRLDANEGDHADV